jgi:hypothetical protein
MQGPLNVKYNFICEQMTAFQNKSWKKIIRKPNEESERTLLGLFY